MFVAVTLVDVQTGMGIYVYIFYHEFLVYLLFPGEQR